MEWKKLIFILNATLNGMTFVFENFYFTNTFVFLQDSMFVDR